MGNVVKSVCEIISTGIFLALGIFVIYFIKASQNTVEEATELLYTINEKLKPNGSIENMLNNAEATSQEIKDTALNVRVTSEGIKNMNVVTLLRVLASGIK